MLDAAQLRPRRCGKRLSIATGTFNGTGNQGVFRSALICQIESNAHVGM